MEQSSRKNLHVHVTAQPTDQWTLPQRHLDLRICPYMKLA
jgi:hypothetical protein